jgi:hypothetical protein
MIAGYNHDLRNSTRRPLRCPASLMVGDEQCPAETIDISAGGVSLQTQSPIDLESSVQLSMELPGEGFGLDVPVAVNCKGRVVRCSPASIAGVHYVAMVIEDYYFEPQRAFPISKAG